MSALRGRAPTQIPRHVLSLNAVAERAGIIVTMSKEPRNDGELRLWSNWRGTLGQLFSVGILEGHQQNILRLGIRPQHHYNVVVPSSERHRQLNVVAAGFMSVNDGRFAWEIDSGPASYRLSECGNVEVVTCVNEIVYHGSPEDLVAIGIPPGRLPGRRARSNGLEHCPREKRWASRTRSVDGSVLYRVESDAAFKRRQDDYAEWLHQHPNCASALDAPPRPRPQLRLVVDNTDPMVQS